MSSGIIDRVAQSLGRRVVEVPVGFKWFVDGLFTRPVRLRGRRECGRQFPVPGRQRLDDRQGRPHPRPAGGRDHRAHRTAIRASISRRSRSQFGHPCYRRLDAAGRRAAEGDPQESVARVRWRRPRWRAIRSWTSRRARRATRPSLGGLKVVTAEGWFAARPSGTEDIYKIYAESFRDEAHLQRIIDEAQEIVDAALAAAQ